MEIEEDLRNLDEELERLALEPDDDESRRAEDYDEPSSDGSGDDD
jgi:hypothetical protein